MESALSIYIYFTKLNYQMLSIAHNIDIYKKCIGLQKSKSVIMNCIATAFKIP